MEKHSQETAYRPQPLRITLVDNAIARRSVLEDALTAAGHSVVGRYGTGAPPIEAVARDTPDLIIMDVDAPDRDKLESLTELNRECPRPTVLFAARSDAETTRQAVHAGVSAYVVAGLHPERLRPIIDMAIARFEHFRLMRQELDRMQSRLADQQDIEPAKTVLMKRRHIGEPEAFGLLRKLAMDRKQRISDVARQLLVAAEAL
jgi:response regulator NasT